MAGGAVGSLALGWFDAARGRRRPTVCRTGPCLALPVSAVHRPRSGVSHRLHVPFPANSEKGIHLVTSRSGLRSRPAFWVGAVAVAIVVGAGAYGLWYLFLRPSGPPPVDIGNVPLPSATVAAAASTAPSSAATTAPAAPAGASVGA